MITTFQPWWYRQMFSCDNWILFFWRHRGNNRSSNLIFRVLNACSWFYLHSVCNFLQPKDEGLLVLNGFVKFTFSWLDRVCNILMTRNKNWSSDWLNYFRTIFAVAIVWRHSAHCAWLTPRTPIDQYNHNHTSHWRRYGIKINQSSIHFPAI